ncbi:MAG: B12-binding domain-containing radical SAM protein [Hyphomicrobiales bacterium]
MKREAPHILLVNPWVHDFAAYDVWAKPLGLLTLAAILREQGCRLSYIDCLDRFHPRAPRIDPSARYGCGPYHKTRISKPAAFRDVPRRFSRYGIDPAWLHEDLSRIETPDIILVTSAMTYWYTGVQETIGMVRAIFPRTPVILGGVYATLCPEHARQCSGADEVFTGPAEPALLSLVRTFTGWTYAERFEPNHLDTYPFPAFDLQHQVNYVPMLTARGCPYACAYCASPLLEPRRLRRSPGSIVEELTHWHRHWGVSDFILYDDAFLADPQGHSLPVLEAVVQSGLPVRFHTPNALHIQGITPETARLMFSAGFTTLRLGLETAEFATRGNLDHKVTAAEFERCIWSLREAGFKSTQIGAYLLVGLPGQQAAAIMRSIDVVKQAGIAPVLAYYSPIPGTRLWSEAVSSSRYDLASDPLFTNKAVWPCRSEPFNWLWISELKQHINA